MTVLEQRFMQQVPGLLHDIAESLKTIAKDKNNDGEIWIVFAESLCDYELIGRHIQVYLSEEEARSCFKNYVDEVRKTCEENEWEIEDREDFFESYPDGSWGTSHETVEIQKATFGKTIYCR